ncbi:outer membrane protein assembly factor BamB [Streptomyces luteogriseus]|uniref:PQQ-binding-like beta-propeller repeat protein n=1 Tax=Streptomyces luteogriseus TaxID=68233 RepID=UPI002784E718|nr:PQQ-binding-like beta-propeller repeat protein [Streptomyces luteogriseus]MDQ0711383.1 outer membrane protein assembly factor BamB [Streptomyces luteogriseus]
MSYRRRISTPAALPVQRAGLQQDGSPGPVGAGPYSTGGGGTVLEHRYGAVLLSHLLTGTPVPGLGDAVTPVRIRFQARSISRVDDIVVVGTAPNKAEVAVSIGVRRQPRLVPSEADSVKLIGDFLHVAGARRGLVDSGRWKLALAVVPSCVPAQQLKTLAEVASAAGSWTEFQDRLRRPGSVQAAVRNRLTQVEAIVASLIPEPSSQAARETWRLLSALHLIEMRLEGADCTDRTYSVERLRAVTPQRSNDAAHALFAHLAEQVGAYAPGGAVVDLPRLHADLQGLDCFAPARLPFPADAAPAPAAATRTPRPSRRRGARMRWKARLLSEAAHQPQVHDGTVVVVDDCWTLAFDTESGHQRWGKKAGGGHSAVVAGGACFASDPLGHARAWDLFTGQRSAPLRLRMQDGLAAVSEGILFAAHPTTGLSAYDVASKAVLWSGAGDQLQVAAAPRAHGGTVFAVMDAPSTRARVPQVLAAFEALSGRTLWCWSSGSCAIVHWSAGGQVLVAVLDTPDRERQLVALDRASGALLWRQVLTGEAAAAPVHAGTAIHLTTRCGRALAWDAQSGHLLWDVQVARRINTAPMVADDGVYIAAFAPGRLVVLEPHSGNELWRKSAGGAFTTTPFMAGDRIWAGDRTGVLHAWDPRTRRTAAQLPVRWSEEGRGQPAVEDRMMFVSTCSGWLQAWELP